MCGPKGGRKDRPLARRSAQTGLQAPRDLRRSGNRLWPALSPPRTATTSPSYWRSSIGSHRPAPTASSGQRRYSPTGPTTVASTAKALRERGITPRIAKRNTPQRVGTRQRTLGNRAHDLLAAPAPPPRPPLRPPRRHPRSLPHNRLRAHLPPTTPTLILLGALSQSTALSTELRGQLSPSRGSRTTILSASGLLGRPAVADLPGSVDRTCLSDNRQHSTITPPHTARAATCSRSDSASMRTNSTTRAMPITMDCSTAMMMPAIDWSSSAEMPQTRAWWT